jgi:hypothetical protein
MLDAPDATSLAVGARPRWRDFGAPGGWPSGRVRACRLKSSDIGTCPAPEILNDSLNGMRVPRDSFDDSRLPHQDRIETMPKSNPHGEVALLLCESLLHVLVEHRVISREAALNAIESVLDLTQESAEVETREVGGGVSASALIERIAGTFAAKD